MTRAQHTPSVLVDPESEGVTEWWLTSNERVISYHLFYIWQSKSCCGLNSQTIDCFHPFWHDTSTIEMMLKPCTREFDRNGTFMDQTSILETVSFGVSLCLTLTLTKPFESPMFVTGYTHMNLSCILYDMWIIYILYYIYLYNTVIIIMIIIIIIYIIILHIIM